MGKQIHYWLGYQDFLQIAHTALDCGCIIIKRVSGELAYGQTLDMVTEDVYCYYFYVPKAGERFGQSVPFENGAIKCADAFRNAVIEAGFSVRNEETKEILRSRLYAASGYYDKNGEYIPRPECVTSIYNRLVRTVKKIALYTELTDTFISTRDDSYLQKKEWKHKEYISQQFLQLTENYKLCP